MPDNYTYYNLFLLKVYELVSKFAISTNVPLELCVSNTNNRSKNNTTTYKKIEKEKKRLFEIGLMNF